MSSLMSYPGVSFPFFDTLPPAFLVEGLTGLELLSVSCYELQTQHTYYVSQ